MDTGNYPYKTYNNRMDFGGCDETDMSFEKCKRLEIIARRVEREKRKKDHPIIKEKQVFDNWKDKPKKKIKKKKYK